ncbi:MAG TPA: LPXTG cell wall anchor domain-containing protein [Candidatus Gemmiger excrementigallinarum]|uniref:LPXTG cell wall anchor domain-containing protein n=1 Tax=Candidatus Gemmiger excrementigallinarum TaxID=2838609 RepID=A0A9D2J9P1_9FIRM|nr:LPXTG cell wall anchor domain-containing protein [Candidatus Gemmiger excrementigallinarum]
MLRKKWISLLVAISMVAAMFPSTVFADADSTELDTTAPTSQTSTEVPEEETPGTEEGEQPNVTDDTTATGEADKGTNESEEDKTVTEETEEETKEPETPADETEEKTEDVEKPASEEADPDEETVVVPPVTTPEVTEDQTANNGIATMAETRTEDPFETGGTTYPTLADAVEKVSPGGIITLKRDLDDAPGVSVPSGKNFTLDFGGHTYTLKNPGAGSTGTETNGFQLLKDSTITFRNGTIRISEENGIGEGKPIMRVIQNYADLTLEGMQIYAEHQYGNEDYVLSFNNGNIIFKGNTSIYTTDPEAIAFDVCYWQSGGYDDGTYVTFENDYSGKIGGTIVYDSTDEAKGTLTIKGNGNFVGIKTSESSINGVGIQISGGTFENSFPAEYLAENVALKEQADGTFKVDEDTPVAKIGEKTYTTLEAAVGEAGSGSTITLLEDVYLGEMLTLDKADVKLDLNGYTISASVDFVDPTPTGSQDATSNDNHLIDVTADGVTITGGTLKAGTLNNHTLNIWNADGVTLENVTLDGSAAGMGGAPLIVGASNVTLKGDIALKTGENSWYGMNVDSRNVSGTDTGASLTLDSANVTVTGPKTAGIYVENSAGDGIALNFQGDPAITGEAEGFVPVQYAVDGTGKQIANATLNFNTNNGFDISDCGFGVTLTVGDGDNLTTTGFNSFEDAFAYVNDNPDAVNPYIILYEDVELDEMLVIDRDDLTINLAGKTIKASENFKKQDNNNNNHLVDIRADNVSLIAGTLQAGENNNHTLNLWNAHGVRLDGVTLDGSAAGIEGAPLVLGASDVTLAGWVRFVQGPNSWYAVNLDSKDEPAVASTLEVVDGVTTVIFDKAGQNNEGIVIDNGANADGMKVDLTGAKISVVNNEEPYTFKVIKYGKNSEDKPMTDEEKANVTVVAPALSQWPDDNYYIVDVDYNEEESSGSSHEHSYVWQGSPDEHWQYCTDCGQVVSNGAHTFQWKDGVQVCSVCGYKVTETSTASAPASSAKTAAAAPAAGTAAAAVATGIPQTGDASNPMLWVVLLAVSGSALGGLMVYKKKKEN